MPNKPDKNGPAAAITDLHLHTSMSDGSDSPLELLEKVECAGCEFFSITDHDDLRANSIILSLMKKGNYIAEFITGCEISSVFEGRNLHLLCYGFDPSAPSVNEMIAQGARLRRQRITAMFDHLKDKHNIAIPEQDRAEILSRAVPGKVHITDAALRLGVKASRREFFDKYLDDMESRHFKISAESVIEMTGRAGGAVSLAHPIEIQREYKIDFSQIGKMVKELKDKGLAALEVYHSLHGEKEVFEYGKTAREYGLLVSGGSDYHGKNKDVRIGQVTSYGYAPDRDKITILSKVRRKL